MVCCDVTKGVGGCGGEENNARIWLLCVTLREMRIRSFQLQLGEV